MDGTGRDHKCKSKEEPARSLAIASVRWRKGSWIETETSGRHKPGFEGAFHAKRKCIMRLRAIKIARRNRSAVNLERPSLLHTDRTGARCLWNFGQGGTCWRLCD